MPFDQTHVNARIGAAADTIAALRPLAPAITQAALALQGVARTGHTIFTAGNGGSAAHALHLAEELLGKYDQPRPPIPATCLAADPTALTCIANDYGFDHVFARQVQALAKPGDALVVLSTSGASPNIILALQAARSKGAATVALLGKGGGEAAQIADHAIVVPADRSELVQEAHQLLVHLIVEAVEAT